MTDHDILQTKTSNALDACPIVPVLTLNAPDIAAKLATILWDCGITTAEITMRTPNALACIEAMIDASPELCVGAGTILNEADLAKAMSVGSNFIVTPAISSELLPALKACPLPVFPGCATASEALELYSNGFKTVKFFPAEANGGVKALKSIGAPMPQIKFMPTGGVTQTSVHDYLALENVVAVGGSWIVNKQAVQAQDWDSVKRTAEQARAAISK